MSVTQTVPSTLKPQGLSRRSWLVGVLILLTAVVINSLIVLAAHAVLTVPSTFTPLQAESFLPATVVAVTGALIVFALISGRAQNPTRLFRRIAVGILIISIIPDLVMLFFAFFPGTTVPEVGAVLLMHVATGLLCITQVPRLSSARA